MLYVLAALSLGAPVLPVRGVAKYEWEKYTQSSFSCDSGGKTIERKMFNDNFCDCEDGSDEPGTPACAGKGAKFACLDGSTVHTSRVNDGICDCCDGSDEYDGDEIQCSFTCGQDGAEDTRLQAIQKFRAGSQKRAAYVEKAGGEVNIRKALQGECYKITSGVFTYEVCPYGKATQSDSKGSVVVGHWQGWEETDPQAGQVLGGGDASAHVMLFGGGDKCGETPRSLKVSIECAGKDEILSESEPSTCEYAMRMGSPIACDAAAGRKLGLAPNGALLDAAEAEKEEEQPDYSLFHSEL